MKDESKTQMTNWAITLVIAAVVGAAGFYGGIKYQQTRPFNGQSMMGGTAQFGARGQGGRTQSQGGVNGPMGGRGGAAFRPVNGEVISVDDKSITVKLQDGSSKIIFLSDATQINKADQASKSDLSTGTKVAVFGQTNSDGSVTAQNIQINPVMRMNASPSPTTK